MARPTGVAGTDTVVWSEVQQEDVLGLSHATMKEQAALLLRGHLSEEVLYVLVQQEKTAHAWQT